MVMNITKEKLAYIISEEIEKILLEESVLKQIGKTVAPFALGATLATAVTDKDQHSPSQEPTAATVEPQKEKTYKPVLDLPEKYNILKTLGDQLSSLNTNFNMDTEKGRAALAIALAIGGTETYGSLKDKKDFYTIMGGGKKVNNRMKGFAQFDTRYHKEKINTPAKYAGFLANIIKGQNRMPNGRRGIDAATELVNDIKKQKIKSENDLIKWLKDKRFGGSNWQGIDDGWGRVPGLANALINFIKNPKKVEL